jgi:FixJ family two-component response regulator
MSISPTVFVVDDDPAVLKAVTRLLQSEGFAARPFHTPEAFLIEHDPSVPGCLVLDMMMPTLNGLALQQALRASGCERFVVFITGQGDVPSSVQAMKDGAVDFLMKPFDDKDFLCAIRAAIEKDLAARISSAQLDSIRQRIATLTRREREVLEHIVTGQLNKQIAADLGTVEKTIKVHRARVMEKMGAGSLVELLRLSLQAGVGACTPSADDIGEPETEASLPELDQSPISPRSHIGGHNRRV